MSADDFCVTISVFLLNFCFISCLSFFLLFSSFQFLLVLRSLDPWIPYPLTKLPVKPFSENMVKICCFPNCIGSDQLGFLLCICKILFWTEKKRKIDRCAGWKIFPIFFYSSLVFYIFKIEKFFKTHFFTDLWFWLPLNIYILNFFYNFCFYIASAFFFHQLYCFFLFLVASLT